MALNKKSQIIITKIMIGIIVFIMAVVFIQPLNEQIQATTNATNLNCTNPSLPVESKATCVIVDMGLFYFISVVIAVGIAFVAGRKTITGIITSIFVFIVVVVLITPLKYWIVLARSNLNCAASSITVAARMTCIFVDLWLFYFIIVCIASAITLAVSTKVVPYFRRE